MIHTLYLIVALLFIFPTQQNKQMNGMKLGVKEKPKNSFVFQNQFLNYQQEDFNDSDEEQEDDEDEEEDEEDQSQQHLPKNPKELGLNSKINQQKPIEKNQSKIKLQEVKVEKKDPKEGNDNQKHVLDKRINNLSQGIEKLSVSIHEMKDNYEDLQSKQHQLKRSHNEKQSQIKNYLEKKRAQKLNLLERKKIQQQKDRKKLEQSLKLQEIERENKQKQKIEENLRKINEIRERREAQKQKSAAQNQKVSQMYEKIFEEEKANKKFHFRKMQEDKVKKMQELRNRHQILLKRKQAFRSIDLSELEQHRRRHSQMLSELEEVKRIKREEANEKIEQQNNNMKELYRGQAHDYVEEEMQQAELRRNEPKQKYKKMKEYQKLVRENYIPKTQQPSARKSIENINRSNLSHREVKRYRYLNGVAYGQILENLPLPKSDFELRKMGNENLEYLKSLPKKRKVEEESIQTTLSPEDLAILDKKLNSIVRVKRERNPLYERQDHRSMDLKISKNPTRDQVSMIFSQLKAKDEKTKLKQKIMKIQNTNSHELNMGHKRINDDIVRNIEQKLNLLSMM